MKCPFCGGTNDKVLDSRASSDNTSIRRRRQCLDCGYRFTSYEKIEEKSLSVHKKNNSYEPFDINKIERAIHICTDKRRLEPKDIESLVNNIERAVRKKAAPNHVISSISIGEIALKEIYKVDKVAYVRFASVYRAYDNVAQFTQEIERIAKDVD